jgi:hypothetical protein
VGLDKAILVQTAGKIAGELVASMQLRNTEEVMNSFNECLVRVLDAMNHKIAEGDKKTKGGRQVPIISQDSLKSRLENTLRAGTAVSSSTIEG